MTRFEEIFEIAADNNGIVTSALARKAGVERSEMARWCNSGRMDRIGHGVYVMSHHVPTSVDPYAQAVALAGEGAFLFGESVIAMHSLAPTDPSRIYVAVPRRPRRRLPSNVRAVQVDAGARCIVYEGVRSQSVHDALHSCLPTMLPDRLGAAADKAAREGLITPADRDELLGKLGL